MTSARRPSWDSYFLQVADVVAVRADCTRRKVGAVIVGQDHRITSTGYNGSPPGEPGCLSDGACPRGRHFKLVRFDYHGRSACVCGAPWPCPDAVEPSSSYDTGPGACIALHAEANALLRAGIQARGAVLYCTDEPCDGCLRLIKGAGIVRIVWPGGQIVLNRREKAGAVRKLVLRLRRA